MQEQQRKVTEKQRKKTTQVKKLKMYSVGAVFDRKEGGGVGRGIVFNRCSCHWLGYGGQTSIRLMI